MSHNYNKNFIRLEWRYTLHNISIIVRNDEGWIDINGTLDKMHQGFEEQSLPDLEASKMRLTPAQRELCENAMEDLTSLARAEKNWTTGLPTPEQEDALLRDRPGTNKDALFQKALDAPAELGEMECEVPRLRRRLRR